MAQELQHALLVGRLVVSPSRDGDGHWCKLEIPQKIVDGLFAALHEPGIEKSPGRAHISVMTSDEVAKVGADKITETGKFFPFRLSGIKHVRPSGWAEMERVYFVVVKSPELKKLRASYGLTPLVHDTHDFHVTIAVRRRGVLAPNNSVTKQAGFIPREALMSVGTGLAGAAAGSLLDRARKRKGGWLQRNIGLLMGGLGGAGAGYGLSQLNKPVAKTDTGPTAPSQQTVDEATDQSYNATHGALDMIRPVDDSLISAKQPELGRIPRVVPPMPDPFNRWTGVDALKANFDMWHDPVFAAGPWGLGMSTASGLLRGLPEGIVKDYGPLRKLIQGVKGLPTVNPAMDPAIKGITGLRNVNKAQGVAKGFGAGAKFTAGTVGYTAADQAQQALGVTGPSKLVNDLMAARGTANTAESAAKALANTDMARKATARAGEWFANKAPTLTANWQRLNALKQQAAEAATAAGKTVATKFPTAAKYLPTATRLMSKMPAAGGKLINYPLSVIADTAMNAPNIIDQSKNEALRFDLAARNKANITDYGLPVGLGMNVARTALQPGQAATALGGELADMPERPMDLSGRPRMGGMD